MTVLELRNRLLEDASNLTIDLLSKNLIIVECETTGKKISIRNMPTVNFVHRTKQNHFMMVLETGIVKTTNSSIELLENVYEHMGVTNKHYV